MNCSWYYFWLTHTTLCAGHSHLSRQQSLLPVQGLFGSPLQVIFWDEIVRRMPIVFLCLYHTLVFTSFIYGHLFNGSCLHFVVTCGLPEKHQALWSLTISSVTNVPSANTQTSLSFPDVVPRCLCRRLLYYSWPQFQVRWGFSRMRELKSKVPFLTTRRNCEYLGERRRSEIEEVRRNMILIIVLSVTLLLCLWNVLFDGQDFNYKKSVIRGDDRKYTAELRWC